MWLLFRCLPVGSYSHAGDSHSLAGLVALIPLKTWLLLFPRLSFSFSYWMVVPGVGGSDSCAGLVAFMPLLTVFLCFSCLNGGSYLAGESAVLPLLVWWLLFPRW